MNKTILVVLLAFVGLFFMQTAHADMEITNEDKAEIKAMATPYGAQVRLIQLEHAIDRNIVAGNIIIQHATEVNASANTSDMRRIVAEMEILAQEVNNASHQRANKTAEVLAKEYVLLKAEARDLSGQFKQEAREVLNSSEREEVEDEIQQARAQLKVEYHQELKTAKDEFNAQIAAAIYADLNVNQTAFIEEVRQGRATIAQIRAQIAADYAKLSKEEKREVRLILDARESRKAVFGKSIEKDLDSYIEVEHDKRVKARGKVLARLNLSDNSMYLGLGLGTHAKRTYNSQRDVESNDKNDRSNANINSNTDASATVNSNGGSASANVNANANANSNSGSTSDSVTGNSGVGVGYS